MNKIDMSTVTQAQLDEARGWVSDCVWGDADADVVAALTDEQVAYGIERHYEGGWNAFVSECCPAEPETFRPTTDAEVKAGDRIRVTRHRPDGRVHFIKTGAVVEVHPGAYVFNEDNGRSRRHWLSGSESLAAGMRGWSQTIERISEGN